VSRGGQKVTKICLGGGRGKGQLQALGEKENKHPKLCHTQEKSVVLGRGGGGHQQEGLGTSVVPSIGKEERGKKNKEGGSPKILHFEALGEETQ